MFISKRLNVSEPQDKSNYYVDPTMVVGSTYFDSYLICCLFNIFGDINLYLYGMIIVIIEKLLYLFIIKK